MRSKFILILMLCALLLCAALVSCGDETSSSAEETTPPITTAQSTTNPSLVETTPKAPDTTAPEMLKYAEEVVSTKGFISVSNESYISGTLLHISEDNPYRYNIPSLPFSNRFSQATQTVKAQNLMLLYGNKSKDYLLANSTLFLKSDAFPHWDALVAAFKEASGKSSLQVVNAYFYTAEAGVANEFVTGYCLAVNLYENGSTFSLASDSSSFDYNGETVTSLSWFQDNCAKYGFIYTGLTGDQQKTLATFRYVGAPHAAIMQKNDVIDLKIYSEIIKVHTPSMQYYDEEKGITWTVIYAPKDTELENTYIELPRGAVFTISGNNIDGFIVAYYMPKEA